MEGEKIKEISKKRNYIKIDKEEVSAMKSKIKEIKEEQRGKYSKRSKKQND